MLKQQRNLWNLHSQTVFILAGFMLCDHHPEMKTEEHFENRRRFKGLKSVSVGVSLQKHVCGKRAVKLTQLLILYFKGQQISLTSK